MSEIITSGDEILCRNDASLQDVNVKQRLVTLLAVPWEQEAKIFWRGQEWNEVFTRGAFDGLESSAGRVMANREHEKGRTVGRVVQVDTQAAEGLVAFVKVAKTPLGEETLALAEEDMVFSSIGYKIKRPSDVDLNRQRMSRRVNRAFLDHISFVEAPAYEDARVLAIRAGSSGLAESAEPVPETPNLDEFVNDDVLMWARSRLSS